MRFLWGSQKLIYTKCLEQCLLFNVVFTYVHYCVTPSAKLKISSLKAVTNYFSEIDTFPSEVFLVCEVCSMVGV